MQDWNKMVKQKNEKKFIQNFLLKDGLNLKVKK